MRHGRSGWLRRKQASFLRARDFLLAAHANGVAPFYVTNRVCDPNKADDPTVVRVAFAPSAVPS